MQAARQARSAALGALVAGALALAACGEDDGADAASTGATAVVADEAESFRAALDQTCVENAIAVNQVTDGEIPQTFRGSAEYQAGQAPKHLVYDFIWDEQGERWLMDSIFEPGTPAPGPEPPGGESSGA